MRYRFYRIFWRCHSFNGITLCNAYVKFSPVITMLLSNIFCAVDLTRGRLDNSKLAQ